MSQTRDLLAFAGVMALGQFSPGPDMILLTRTALREGAAAGVRTALGIACGLAVHSTIAVAGLALAFEKLPPPGGLLLRFAAAGYLLWLAWGMARERFVVWYSGGIGKSMPAPSTRGPFLRGLFCNLLNPKAAIFLAAVSAPFLEGNRPDWWPAALWAVVVFQGGTLWALWARLLQWRPLRSGYHRSEPWIDAAFALALVALAAWLIVG